MATEPFTEQWNDEDIAATLFGNTRKVLVSANTLEEITLRNKIEEEPIHADEGADPFSGTYLEGKQREPEDAHPHLPKFLIVQGRRGYNEVMNGQYKRGAVHQGKVHYAHNSPKNTFVMRWCPSKSRWFFDFRGLKFDEIASACVTEDVESPDQITKSWLVYDGEICRWKKDRNIKILKLNDN